MHFATKPLRNIAFLLIAILCASGAFSIKAQAHVLESDNGVSAVLHIVPDDDPVAGVPTTVGFEFNSTDPRFKLSDYTIEVIPRGTSVTTSIPPVTLGAADDSPLYGTAQVTFPEAGSYNLTIRGTPLNAGNAFNITYEIRAEQPASAEEAQTTVNSAGFDSVMISVASLGLLGVVAQYQIRQGGRYDKK